MSKKAVPFLILISSAVIGLAFFSGFEIGKGNSSIIPTSQIMNVKTSENITSEDVTFEPDSSGENNEKKYPIDIEFDKEMSKWSGNTGEGVNIVYTYGDKWKAEMEEYYNLLYDKLDNDKKKWLISSQEKWEIYSKENEELGYQIYEQVYQGGSIIQILASDIYYNKYRDRALDLKGKYESIISNQ